MAVHSAACGPRESEVECVSLAEPGFDVCTDQLSTSFQEGRAHVQAGLHPRWCVPRGVMWVCQPKAQLRKACSSRPDAPTTLPVSAWCPSRHRRSGAQLAAGRLHCACVVEAEALPLGVPPTALPTRSAGRGGAAAGPGGGGGGRAAPVGGQRAAAQEHAGGPHRPARAAPAGQAAAAAGAAPRRARRLAPAPRMLSRPRALRRPCDAPACRRPWASHVCLTPLPLRDVRFLRVRAPMSQPGNGQHGVGHLSPPGEPKHATRPRAR
jgi:hypothetical protein